MNTVFQPGFGQQLKSGREALGLTVGDVAAKLKLTARQIENLETENFPQLPGEVFVRGFVRNYARLVSLDPETLLLPVEASMTVANTITAPSEGLTFSSPGVQRWVLLPALGLAIFILLVAVLYHWLREGEEALVVQPIAVQPALPVIAPVTIEPLAPPPLIGVPAPSTTEAVSPASPAAPGPTALPTAPAPAPTLAPVEKTATVLPSTQTAPTGKPVQIAPTATIHSAPPKPIAPPPLKPVEQKADKAHGLRFAPASDAWIQVVDGKGKHFSRLVKAGTAETFEGHPPFRLVVGEAAQVKMSYNGQTVDLTPFIGEKVARLTLE